MVYCVVTVSCISYRTRTNMYNTKNAKRIVVLIAILIVMIVGVSPAHAQQPSTPTPVADVPKALESGTLRGYIVPDGEDSLQLEKPSTRRESLGFAQREGQAAQKRLDAHERAINMLIGVVMTMLLFIVIMVINQAINNRSTVITDEPESEPEPDEPDNTGAAAPVAIGASPAPQPVAATRPAPPTSVPPTVASSLPVQTDGRTTAPTVIVNNHNHVHVHVGGGRERRRDKRRHHQNGQPETTRMT